MFIRAGSLLLKKLWRGTLKEMSLIQFTQEFTPIFEKFYRPAVWLIDGVEVSSSSFIVFYTRFQFCFPQNNQRIPIRIYTYNYKQDTDTLIEIKGCWSKM